jgi:hypothetical protein
MTIMICYTITLLEIKYFQYGNKRKGLIMIIFKQKNEKREYWSNQTG